MIVLMRKAVWAGALGSIAFTAPYGLFLSAASKRMRGAESGSSEIYGPVLFVATPMLHGIAASVLSQAWGPQSWKTVAKATWISIGLIALGLLIARWEGIVCILMGMPLILPLAFFGAWIGWKIRRRQGGAMLSLPTVAVLALAAGGGMISPAPVVDGDVRTTWWVDAPPERVWRYVLSIDSMPEPDWWLFRLGVAYPVRTLTRPDGTRTCGISTGPMPEIVTVREENRRLAFRVLATPPSMKELNPFGEVHAAHLSSSFHCREGEFRLFPERGGTRIEARSTYGLRMGPAWYWQLWSDAIVRHVHERVVREISRRAAAP